MTKCSVAMQNMCDLNQQVKNMHHYWQSLLKARNDSTKKGNYIPASFTNTYLTSFLHFSHFIYQTITGCLATWVNCRSERSEVVFGSDKGKQSAWLQVKNLLAKHSCRIPEILKKDGGSTRLRARTHTRIPTLARANLALVD